MAAAGEPAGLRSEANRKTFRRIAIRAIAAGQPRLRMPQFAPPPAAGVDTRPLFVLRAVTVSRRHGDPARRPCATTYQPYLGKKVSQADLAAIAAGDQRPLSRRRLSPEPGDRPAAGHRRRPGSDPGDRRQHHRSGAEGRRRRTVRHPAAARPGSGRTSVATGDAGTAIAADQRPRRRAHRRYRDRGDRRRDRPFPPRRLPEDLARLHLVRDRQSRLLRRSARGRPMRRPRSIPICCPATRWRVNLSTTPGDPRELAFGRLSYDVPLGTDGSRIGASALYSEVRPGDDRRLFNDSTTTEAFEIRGSIVPLQSQRSSLTLTAAFDFSNVRGSAMCSARSITIISAPSA